MYCKLIIVEDEKIIREHLKNFEWDSLQVKVVESFSDGLSALEYIRDNEVDIALVDIKMPIMSGVEFAKCVSEECLDVSIICLSGHSDYDYLRECMQYGVRDYLLKPVDKQDLFSAISRLTTEKKQTIVFQGVKQMNNDVHFKRHTIVRALEYIEKNYHNPIKLSDVADYVGLNSVYFSRSFKQETGVRFVDYLAELRIEKSMLLLRSSKLNISEIAYSTGFFSSRYFAETFKKRKGMTPSEYRNQGKAQ